MLCVRDALSQTGKTREGWKVCNYQLNNVFEYDEKLGIEFLSYHGPPFGIE